MGPNCASSVAQKPEGDDYEVKKLTGGPRFCRSCQMFKPPRAHHCRQCRRYLQLSCGEFCSSTDRYVNVRIVASCAWACITSTLALYMVLNCFSRILITDHHCPWVNNCVGHFNYAHFIRFLVYVDISCSYHLWMLTARAYGAYNTAQGYWVSRYLGLSSLLLTLS